MGYQSPATAIASILEMQGRDSEWLSEASGVRHQAILGRVEITLNETLAVARTLGVSIVELVGDEDQLTVTELAAATKHSADTIYRKARDGSIPGFKVGGSWRFYLSEVIAAGRPRMDDIWEQPERARRRRAA